MKKASFVLWGLVLMVAGVVLSLKVLGIANFNVFFRGWWTVFIIVPCTVGLFAGKRKIANLMGIGLGVFMLLCCQKILSWKLSGPVALVIIGLKLILIGVMSKAEENNFVEPEPDNNQSE